MSKRNVAVGDLLKGAWRISDEGVEEWFSFPRFKVVAIHMDKPIMFLETFNPQGETIGYERMNIDSSLWAHFDEACSPCVKCKMCQCRLHFTAFVPKKMTPLNGVTIKEIIRTIDSRISSEATEVRIACEICTNAMVQEIINQTGLNCYFDYPKGHYIFTAEKYSLMYREENNLTVFK